jgi:hypothetical protein
VISTLFRAVLTLAGVLWLVSPAQAQVALDAWQNGTTGTSTLSWTHTPTGTPRGIIVQVTNVEGADEVTTATYGGVSMTEVSCSPVLNADAGVDDAMSAATFFLGSSIPTGAQTVVVSVSGSGSKRSVSMSLTASADTEIVDCEAVNSDSTANPSVTLSLGGRTSFATLHAMTGRTATTQTTALTNWKGDDEPGATQGPPGDEVDLGTVTALYYTYDIVGTTDITAGYTASADDVAMIAVAVAQVPGAAVPCRLALLGVGCE